MLVKVSYSVLHKPSDRIKRFDERRYLQDLWRRFCVARKATRHRHHLQQVERNRQYREQAMYYRELAHLGADGADGTRQCKTVNKNK